ncbi:uncharacterized protein Z518_03497 [Rhinocladiella mackenziei CBS 650.93]|uniref:Condensation domain-containing protein n=1 Tax=Rhinocladiella mackenziei CBS 650.93 TaxID=1442369 RepID=A0A0D2JHL4_9EURO|nr:uncharacterized protein Z518_03497 [Rhinocladiella mackenziei CBS 650.93]KIX08840.1 hypothetical protein Z518_03497 [Rhinocladiella mackenziei CBS 650.93]
MSHPPFGIEKSSESIFITRNVDVESGPKDITVATLLTASWAFVLARHLNVRDVTFGSVVTGRSLEHFDADRIMGPCYHVRIDFENRFTVIEFLRFVQNQAIECGQYAAIGLKQITQACTNWPSDTKFFDSPVHHQDIDYFDTLPFGSGSCRVGLLNPHPEPAQEWKIVSFPKEGEICIGIETSESWVDFATGMLLELAGTVTLFAQKPDADLPWLR